MYANWNGLHIALSLGSSLKSISGISTLSFGNLSFYFFTSNDCTLCINNALFIFIPNVLGWFLAFPISLITYSIILRIRVSACIFPFLLSFATCGLIEAITVIIFPFAIFTLSDVSTQLVGNCVIFIISIFISLLPLNKLYLFANKGKLIFKLILSYVSLLYIVTVALTKIDSIDAIAILPMTVTFMVILLLADIMVLNQQRTITIQQQDIKD